MRTLARAATSSLVMLGAALALMVAAVAAIGILGTRAATGQGNEIAGDEDEAHGLDLDHFKQVNDQRGHQDGDQVLASVGATLRNVLRARDFAGRNGGEEFAVLLPDTSIAEALEIAERVRVAVAEISLPGSDVSVTASVGVAVFPDHASTPDRLERLADAALYLAKRQSRNRVELADPSPAPAVSAANGAAPLTEAAHGP